jgi:hypothetical protein
MSEPAPDPPPFQYSLWSLVILVTVAAIVCSMVASAGWVVPMLIIVGTAICLVGFGPLSRLKHPGEGYVFVVSGFAIRLLGLAIVAAGVLLWVTGPGHGR